MAISANSRGFAIGRSCGDPDLLDAEYGLDFGRLGGGWGFGPDESVDGSVMVLPERK
jgi:hypothetical protein